MGVISKITKRLDVPNEPGQWIEIRMLSWLTLDKAKKEKLKEFGALSRTFVQLREAIAANGTAALEEARVAAKSDPVQEFDKLTLLKHGIAAWSYGDEVAPEDFDEPTAEWAARQILNYTLPTEAETKTPSSLSTGI